MKIKFKLGKIDKQDILLLLFFLIFVISSFDFTYKSINTNLLVSQLSEKLNHSYWGCVGYNYSSVNFSCFMVINGTTSNLGKYSYDEVVNMINEIKNITCIPNEEPECLIFSLLKNDTWR